MKKLLFRVPMGVPDWGRQEMKTILKIALNGFRYSDENIKKLESVLCNTLGVKFCIATEFGKQAIGLAIRALELKHGDGIILPSFLCPTVLIQILNHGCQPQFVDIGDDFNLSPESIEHHITRGTRAILMPHLFGKTAEVAKIIKIARDHDLFIIDDAAQSLGARWEGRLMGTCGDVGILSFGPFKGLTATRGGAFLTNNEKIFNNALKVPLPMTSDKSAFERAIKAFLKFRYRKYTLNCWLKLRRLPEKSDERKIEQSNSDLSEYSIKRISGLDAALTICQIYKMQQVIEKRKKNAKLLLLLISDQKQLKFQNTSIGDHVFTKLIVGLPALKNQTNSEKYLSDNFKDYMRNCGIEAQGTYMPLHCQNRFSCLADSSLAKTEAIWSNLVSLPVNPNMTKSDINYVATCLKRFFRECSYLIK